MVVDEADSACLPVLNSHNSFHACKIVAQKSAPILVVAGLFRHSDFKGRSFDAANHFGIGYRLVLRVGAIYSLSLADMDFITKFAASASLSVMVMF